MDPKIVQKSQGGVNILSSITKKPSSKSKPKPSTSSSSSETYQLDEITHYEKNYETKNGPQSSSSGVKGLVKFNFDQKTGQNNDSNSSDSDSEFDLSEKLAKFQKLGQNFPQDDDDEVMIEGDSHQNQQKNFKISRQDCGVALRGNGFSNSTENQIKVSRIDVIFSILFLMSTLIQFLTDMTMVIWHYRDGFNWASGLTATFMVFGSIGVLHQFNLYQYEHIKRIFNAGKRTRILVNCFPPITLILSSYELTKVGFQSRSDQMISGRFNEIENFLKGCTRVQSYFQAAPLTVLQITVLTEDLTNISILKGIFMGLNIFFNLSVMTIANMPSRADDQSMRILSRSSWSKIFIGIRMFSSFGSREMSVAYLFIGLRCIFTPSYQLNAFIVGSSIIIFPRMILAIIDFIRSLIVQNQNRNSSHTPTSMSKNEEKSLKNTILGYFATIFFPVGEPLWMFWLIWGETAIFLMFGNISGILTSSCVPNLVNATYTGVAIVVFLVVPILIPFAKAQIKRREMQRLENKFNSKTNTNTDINADRNRISTIEELEEPC